MTPVMFRDDPRCYTPLSGASRPGKLFFVMATATTRSASASSVTLGFTAGTATLALGSAPTLTFDAAGRPRALFENDRYIARGWDGRCLEKKWTAGPDGRSRRDVRPLNAGERAALRRRFLDLLEGFRRDLPALRRAKRFRCLVRGRPVRANDDRAEIFAAKAHVKLTTAWESESEDFHRTYRPIGVLPPDQYLSLVLQATEGCAWNRCSFCDFYAGQTFRIKSPEEFERHLDDVERLFGPALAGRCSLFLGAANALDVPPAQLIPAVKRAAARFPGLARPQDDGVGGVYAFGEATRLARWSPEDLRTLQRAGLRRVYLGVETGDPTLRRKIRKPGDPDAVVAAIRKLKNAGIHAGPIVLLGIGGREHRDRHVAGTADLLARAPLGPGDMIYFSPYEGGPSRPGETPLTENERWNQRTAMEARLPDTGARRAHYDIREFLYA